jgi:hypothetical protein
MLDKSTQKTASHKAKFRHKDTEITERMPKTVKAATGEPFLSGNGQGGNQKPKSLAVSRRKGIDG